MPHAIVDVGKTGGDPDLNLPADVVLTDHPPLCWTSPVDEASTLAACPFFYVLIDEADRWVAFVSSSEADMQWLETLGLSGTELYRLTDVYVRDNKAALQALGLSFEGDDLVCKHVIYGQPRLIEAADPP